jgi:hypothetical protein
MSYTLEKGSSAIFLKQKSNFIILFENSFSLKELEYEIWYKHKPTYTRWKKLHRKENCRNGRGDQNTNFLKRNLRPETPSSAQCGVKVVPAYVRKRMNIYIYIYICNCTYVFWSNQLYRTLLHTHKQQKCMLHCAPHVCYWQQITVDSCDLGDVMYSRVTIGLEMYASCSCC